MVTTTEKVSDVIQVVDSIVTTPKGGFGGVWIAGDLIGHARMNQKTLLVDTGSNISVATAYVGMMAYCTSTGYGFTVGLTYQYDGTKWNLLDLTGAVPASQVADIYDTTIGDYTTPSAASSSSATGALAQTTKGSTSTYGALSTGKVYVNNLFSGLLVGQTIHTVGYNIQTNSGNMRVKVYKDDGTAGAPGTLLGESASTAIGATGWLDIALLVDVTIPADGKVWVGMEVDNSTAQFYYVDDAGPGYYIAHAYGTGPSPFGSGTSNPNNTFNCRIAGTGPSYSGTNLYDNNTATEWISISQTAPWAYVDMGSQLLLTACAIYWDGITTTSQQILVQTSPDASTWTTVRTINTNLLQNGSWNYFRWNIPSAYNTSLPRYVRFIANDAGNVVLAIWEIKIKQYANTTASVISFMSTHGHPQISSSIATMPLNA